MIARVVIKIWNVKARNGSNGAKDGYGWRSPKGDHVTTIRPARSVDQVQRYGVPNWMQLLGKLLKNGPKEGHIVDIVLQGIATTGLTIEGGLDSFWIDPNKLVGIGKVVRKELEGV